MPLAATLVPWFCAIASAATFGATVGGKSAAGVYAGAPPPIMKPHQFSIANQHSEP